MEAEKGNPIPSPTIADSIADVFANSIADAFADSIADSIANVAIVTKLGLGLRLLTALLR